MASSSSTSANEMLHHLELECQYLTQALSKLQRHSPEWKYMLNRLEMANKELEERRRDLGERDINDSNNDDDEVVVVSPNNSSTSSSSSPSLPTGGRYVIETSHDRRDNTRMNGADRSSASNHRFYPRNGPKDVENGGCIVSPLQDDDEDDASFAPFVMRDEDLSSINSRKQIQHCIRFGAMAIMLITGILLVALNVGKQSNNVSAMTEGISIDGYYTSSDPLLITEPCSSFSMRLIPDQFANETTWKVVRYDSGNFTDVFSGGPYSYRSKEFADSQSGAIVAKTCLPVGDYKFIISDVRGDGICCDYGRGEYSINLSKGRVIHRLSSMPFSSEREATSFLVTEDDIDVYPVTSTTISLPPTTPSMTSPSPNDSDSSTDDVFGTSSASDVQNTLDESNNVDIITVDTNTNPSTDDDVYSIVSLDTVSDNSTMTGRGKSYGILFDIANTASTFSYVVKGMDLVLDTITSTHYEIWSKVGSWQDVIGDNPDYFEGFRLVSHGTITGKGASKFTEISLHEFHDVEIEYGHRRAFWVTLSDDNLVFQNYEREGITRHELENIVQASRDEFRVYYGAAVRAYPLELADPVTDFWYNAGFLGRVWYEEEGQNDY